MLQHKVRHNQENQGLGLANQGESTDQQVRGLLQQVVQLQHLELVQVEQFHGTEQGKILMSGKYSVVNGEHTIQHRFALELAQPEAGYPSMVATLGQGWQQVVTDIGQSFKPDVLKVKTE